MNIGHLANAIGRGALNIATLGEYEHPGDLSQYGQGLVHSFDPTTREGMANWIGFIAAHRAPGETLAGEATSPAAGWGIANQRAARAAAWPGYQRGWAAARGTPVVRPPLQPPRLVGGQIPGGGYRGFSIGDMLRQWAAGRQPPPGGGFPGGGYRGG